MITVHYLNELRAHRIVWLLEELGVPYEIVRYTRDKGRRAPPELRQIHPLGKSPVIQDGDRIVAESGAIIEYLIDAYGAGRFMPPRATQAYLDYTYWLHYAEGSAMPLLFLKLVISMLPARAPFLVRPIISNMSKRVQGGFTDPQIRTHMDFWETTLKKSPWFAGSEFSAADIQMSYPVEAAMARLSGAGAHPSVQDWISRIRARPAYKKSLDVVGEKSP